MFSIFYTLVHIIRIKQQLTVPLKDFCIMFLFLNIKFAIGRRRAHYNIRYQLYRYSYYTNQFNVIVYRRCLPSQYYHNTCLDDCLKLILINYNIMWSVRLYIIFFMHNRTSVNKFFLLCIPTPFFSNESNALVTLIA